MDNKFDETMKFNVQKETVQSPKEILNKVCEALEAKGYNPINQIIGYILSGDPTYITSYNDARSMIIQMERDELLEAILVDYLKWLIGAYNPYYF